MIWKKPAAQSAVILPTSTDWLHSLKAPQQSARDRKNVFAQLMEAVEYNSEGQISHALYEVGGEYRRNM
jgi:methylmalonyl-CoA mutase N-terminal domain/subunit